MSDKHDMRNALIVIFAVALASVLRAADPPAAAPLPGSRVLRTFDFEETALGNFENVPMYWSKVVGKGFPAYSNGAFDHAVVRSPTTSFKLETSGGSVAYRLNPPPDKRIPVHSDSDYYVLAFAKTAQLQHARADITAWFADEQGNLLPASELHSQPYTPTGEKSADKDADTWRVLYLYIPGPSPASNATSLVLQLGLMQPQQLPPAPAESGKPNLGRFEIYQQDIQGAVWFDDLVVFQLPRVAVSVPANITGSIFSAKQNIDLDVVVSDMGTVGAGGGGGGASHPMDARLRITDPDGLLLASEHWPASATAQQSWKMRYSHPPLPPGLYTATLEVTDGNNTAQGTPDVIIARRQAQFLCLPQTPVSHPAPEFGLSVTAPSSRSAAETLTLWPTLLQDAGAGLVQLPVWRTNQSDDALLRRDPTFDALLTTLERGGIRSIGTFSTIPTVFAKKLPSSGSIDSRSVLSLVNASPDIWNPYFSFALTRYANRVENWELGDPAAPFSGDINDPGAHDRFMALYNQTAPPIAALLNRPHLLIPWNALVDFDPRQFPAASLDLRLPSVIRAAQIPAYIDNFRTVAPAAATPFAPRIFAHIEASDLGHLPHLQRLADFAQRVVYAKSAHPTGILYDMSGDAPDELLLVYRTLSRTIGAAAFVGELPIAPGIHAFLFNKGDSGTLVLWSDSANVDLPLDLPLGAVPVVTDLLGGQRTMTPDPRTGFTHLVASATPIILENLDPRPLQLKTSFALATANFPSGAGSLRSEVLLTNPYADTLSGTLRITVPKGWSTEPALVHLALAPGATLHQPVTIRYPFTENAGKKEITGKLILENTPGITAQELALSFPCAVTSDQVQMEGFAQILDNGDILIQQMVTNISDVPLSAQAYAVLPNYARQQRYVVSLPPGQTAIKRFSFAAADFTPEGKTNHTPAEIVAALAGQKATLGLLRQTDGKVLLTKTIPLD